MQTWWRNKMETFSALLALCAGNSPVTGEFPSQRPVTRSFDAFFDMRLNKRLSKQSIRWWFGEVIMNHSGYAPSQWEMTIQCNVVSHWLSAYTEWWLGEYGGLDLATFRKNRPLLLAKGVVTVFLVATDGSVVVCVYHPFCLPWTLDVLGKFNCTCL